METDKFIEELEKIIKEIKIEHPENIEECEAEEYFDKVFNVIHKEDEYTKEDYEKVWKRISGKEMLEKLKEAKEKKLAVLPCDSIEFITKAVAIGQKGTPLLNDYERYFCSIREWGEHVEGKIEIPWEN